MTSHMNTVNVTVMEDVQLAYAENDVNNQRSITAHKANRDLTRQTQNLSQTTLNNEHEKYA